MHIGLRATKNRWRLLAPRASPAASPLLLSWFLIIRGVCSLLPLALALASLRKRSAALAGEHPEGASRGEALQWR